MMCSFHSLEIIGSVLPQYFLGIFDNGKDHPGTWGLGTRILYTNSTYAYVSHIGRVQFSYGFDAFIHLIELFSSSYR